MLLISSLKKKYSHTRSGSEFGICSLRAEGERTMNNTEKFKAVGLLSLGLLLIVFFSGCGHKKDSDICPSKDGYTLCGYCSADAATSSAPNAGKCEYCPTGGTCGDACTMTSCGGSGGGGDCSYYYSLFKCHQTVNGIEYVGGLVPATCNCPSNTTYAGMDNVSAGGPWKMCTCK